MTALFLAFAIAVFVEGNPEAAIDLNNHAAQLYKEARYPEAEKFYRQALDAAAQSGAEAAPSRAVTLGNLATLLRVTGRYAEAEEILSSLLKQQTADRDTSPPAILRTLHNLAGISQAQGDLIRAEALVLRAEKLLAANPELPTQERVSLNLLLAGIRLDQRRYSDAGSILQATIPGVTGTRPRSRTTASPPSRSPGAITPKRSDAPAPHWSARKPRSPLHTPSPRWCSTTSRKPAASRASIWKRSATTGAPSRFGKVWAARRTRTSPRA